MPYPIPVCVIYRNPQTGVYGFEFSFDGQPPHYQMEVFESVERVLQWADPHNERIWVQVEGDPGGVLMVSREYVPGSAEDRNCKWQRRTQREGETE